MRTSTYAFQGLVKHESYHDASCHQSMYAHMRIHSCIEAKISKKYLTIFLLYLFAILWVKSKKNSYCYCLLFFLLYPQKRISFVASKGYFDRHKYLFKKILFLPSSLLFPPYFRSMIDSGVGPSRHFWGF